MAEFGLFVRYEYCTGCHSCEIACREEHGFAGDQSGICVTEYVMGTPQGLSIQHLPFPTVLCDLCSARTGRGELPACVKQCQASCMSYGRIEELAGEMAAKPRSAIFRPL